MENFNEMVKLLGLTDQIQWDFALYWLFFINVILLMVQPEGSAFATMLGIAVLVSAVIDKTFAFGYMLDPGAYTPQKYHEEVFIGTYLVRVAMFVGPLTVAGSTKDPKVRGLAIIAGISGGVYMFARWFFQQYKSDVKGRISYLDIQFALQDVGLLLLLGRVWLRHHFTVNRNIPVTVLGNVASDDVEIKIA